MFTVPLLFRCSRKLERSDVLEDVYIRKTAPKNDRLMGHEQ